MYVRWLSVVLFGCLLTFAIALLALAREEDQSAIEKEDSPRPKYQTISLPGRFVWLSEALKRQFGITTVPEAKERGLALETTDRQVIPIVEDVRGRAFRNDERLREMDVELLVRRYLRSPVVQIVRIYERTDDGKFLIDYWCDVCAIVMFEAGPCSCCQDDNRLRRRRVDSLGNPVDE